MLTNQYKSLLLAEGAIRELGFCGSIANAYTAYACPTARGGRLSCCAPSNPSYSFRRQEA